MFPFHSSLSYYLLPEPDTNVCAISSSSVCRFIHSTSSHMPVDHLPTKQEHSNMNWVSDCVNITFYHRQAEQGR